MSDSIADIVEQGASAFVGYKCACGPQVYLREKVHSLPPSVTNIYKRDENFTEVSVQKHPG